MSLLEIAIWNSVDPVIRNLNLPNSFNNGIKKKNFDIIKYSIEKTTKVSFYFRLKFPFIFSFENSPFYSCLVQPKWEQDLYSIFF